MPLSPTAAPGATEPQAGEKIAVIQTNLGRIVAKFFPEVAPNHSENFLKLAESGFYNGTRFHRVIPGFVIQGGDPNTKDKPRSQHGTGGPGWNVNAEFNEVPHTPGILSMARSGHPDSAGSQFFVCTGRVPHLDRQYTVFGQVIEGMDVVEKIVSLKRDSNDNPLEENPAIMENVSVATWPLED